MERIFLNLDTVISNNFFDSFMEWVIFQNILINIYTFKWFENSNETFKNLQLILIILGSFFPFRILLFQLDANIKQIEVVCFISLPDQKLFCELYFLILFDDVEHIFEVLKGKKCFKLLQLLSIVFFI